MLFQITEISIKTTGKTDILDLTSKVREVMKRSNVQNGTVILFIPGSTAALTTIEMRRA